MPEAALIDIHNATLWRDDTLVFENLNLTIPQHQRVAILGPNGSGKTTLLKTINRELYPVAKEDSWIRILGRDRWNVWELRERIGVVSHDLHSRYTPTTTALAVVASGFQSSIGIHGVKIPGTHYQETKKRAEDRVLASGLDATIFRPSIIFGDPRGLMEFATQLFKDMVEKPIPAVGFFSGLSPTSGAVLMSPVHVEDVANAFVNTLTDDSTVGEIYNLGGPEILSWTEMLRRIAAATGRKKWIIPMPIVLMKIAATLLDWLPFFPVTRDQLTMLAEGNTADPAVAESLTGSPPRAFSPATLDYLNH